VLRDIENGDPALRPGEAKKLVGNEDVTGVFRKFHRVKLVNGQRVHLEYAVISSGRATTKSAINRFHRRLNGLDADAPNPAEIDRAHRESEARLEAAGL